MMSVKQFFLKATNREQVEIFGYYSSQTGAGGVPGGAAVEDLHLHGARHLRSTADPPRNTMDFFK